MLLKCPDLDWGVHLWTWFWHFTKGLAALS
jgi:hypothetical protein